MGGAQPLAATMAGASMLAVEVPAEPHRAAAGDPLSRPQGGDAGRGAGDRSRECHAKGEAVSVGLLGNAAEIFPELVKRAKQDKAWRPDAVTDQTSAHDPLNGYLPAGWSLEQAEKMRAERSRRA